MDNDAGGSQGNEQNAKKQGKRNFHRHTPQQIQRLEAYFKECPHPDEEQRYNLCQELKLEADQVKFWFQNKRTQSKAQVERSSNILLRGENERIQCENEAMLEALKNVICLNCGGPPFGMEEREINLQKLRLENAQLKEKRDKLLNFLSKNKQPIMVDSLSSIQQSQQQIFDTPMSNGPDPSNSKKMQAPTLSEVDIRMLSETAASAVEELKRLFFTEEQFWVKSFIDGTYVIDQGTYEKYMNATRHFRNVSARVESSKDFAIVHMEATDLIQMFLDSEKWKEFFPTIVNKAKTIHVVGTDLPITENCNVLQVIWEQLHILSPLVPPREFMILRCCQEIEQGLWIVVDVSHNIVDFDLMNASCYKRPSGCLIQALPNGLSKVTWIEHVEVDDKSDTHQMYRDILCGRSGYGAKRWLVTLERMCERIALFSILNIPANDWSEIITSVEGRRCVMKLGERMLKNFNEMLTMSGKVEFPQHSKSGVRIAVRMNIEDGEPGGLIVCAASSISVPPTPLQVFHFLRNLSTRQQWDALCRNNVVTEIAHIATGSSDTNYVTIIKPIDPEDNGKLVAQDSDEKHQTLMIQDCYMDTLGGMLVYAPIDMSAVRKAVSGSYNPSKTEILPSGFVITSNGDKRSTAAASTSTATAEGCGGSLLTVAFQILVSSKASRSRVLTERSVSTVSSLISSTVQNVKALLNGLVSE